MLNDQVTAQIRQLLTALGTILGMLGFVGPDLVGPYIDTIMAAIGSAMVIYSSGWSIYANLKSSLIASVKAIPEVNGVVTANTVAGRALADSIPGRTVAAAGTADAISLGGSRSV